MAMTRKLAQTIIILGLTLLAFALRSYRLDFQSLWIDEGWTVYFAGQPLPQLFHLLRSQEIHPPGYFPTLNLWQRLAGSSEFALRYYSLLFSVLAVPLVYRLGRSLGSRRVGLIAALLITVAPYQIWHAQEARMYSMLTAASALSMWGFVNWQRRGGRRWWGLYLLGTLWAISTHYHGLVVIGIQGLFLLLTGRRYWSVYLKWAGALALLLLLYAPWLIYSGAFVRDYVGWLPQPPLWQTYLRSAKAYSLGELVPDRQAIWPTLAFAALYGLGLFYAARRRGWDMLAFLLAYTLAPNLAAWLFGELRGSSVYLERYLIPVQAGYLLTVSIGLLAIGDGLPNLLTRINSPPLLRSSAPRLTASLLLLTLVAINGWVLAHHYTDPAYAKPNWRTIIRTIENFSLPGDAILFTGDGGEKLFDYYYRGHLPVYYNFNTPVPPPDEARRQLARIAAGHQRLWFSPYGVEIDALLEGWLAGHSYPAWHSWLGRKRLALYGTQATTGRQEEINLAFGQLGPTLLRAELPNTPTPAGDLLPLALTWRADSPLPADYQLSLRLVNHYGDTFTQSDWPPLAAGQGASTWPPGQPITDRRSLWLPPDTPPGNYLLQLVLYNPHSGQPAEQPVAIDNIIVGPADIIVPAEALSIPNFKTQNSKPKTQNLKLIGHALPDQIQPGEQMWLWLYWQAGNSPPTNIRLRFNLQSNGETFSAETPLADSVGSLDTWRPGQVRRAVYHLPTSPRLTGELATVSVTLIAGDGSSTDIPVGRVNLKTRPRTFEPPDVPSPLNVTFGEAPLLQLLGYELAAGPLAPGDALAVTLYWQARAEMAVDYTVFAQLLNSANQVVAQVDTPPLAGAAPTTTWLPGEFLTDPYRLPLPADLPPGQYRLIAGLYDPATGQRLPTSSTSDFVELGRVTVK